VYLKKEKALAVGFAVIGIPALAFSLYWMDILL